MTNRLRYFSISYGLRGMYMPDSSFVVAVKSRRALKALLETEAEGLRDTYTGASKRAVAALATSAWANQTVYDAVMPLKPIGRDESGYGMMVGNSHKEALEASQADDQ